MQESNTQNTGSLAAKALEIAAGYVGQQEVPKGSNWGPFVRDCLACVGLTAAAPWCMALMFRCFNEAAKALGMNNPVRKTASVHDCWNNTSANKKIFKTEAISRPELVTPGCQGVMFLGPNAGHTFIVERVEGMVIYTIEGNSNTDGSREGYEVVRHQRRIDDKAIEGFIKY